MIYYFLLIILYFICLGQSFEVEGKEIIFLFDPPHLIKGIKNSLLTKNLAMKNNIEKIASWDVMKTAWIMDNHLNIT